MASFPGFPNSSAKPRRLNLAARFMHEEETDRRESIEHRFLILAPVGNDAAVTAKLLEGAGIPARPCTSAQEMIFEAGRGCAGLIVAEEALGTVTVPVISRAVQEQPSWSDLPIIAITTRGERVEVEMKKLSLFGPGGNVAVLERPFRPLAIVNAAQVALRARKRQYQVRDLMIERERILADLERNVELRTGELRETNAQLEELVYSIAHDLRAPLRSMQGFSTLLIEQYGPLLQEEGRNFAERVVRSAEAMDAITLDLLSYGRMARSEVVLGAVSVSSAWAAAVFQCEKSIEEKNAIVQAIEPLPAVVAQAAILTQVLANLLSNGLKFIRDGQPPRIILRAENGGSRVRLWIEDNGIGIPAQYRERIFRVFERLDGNKYQGTGIGLSIVRKGVERMGGTVGVESEPGHGSRFWIELRNAEPNQIGSPDDKSAHDHGT